MEAARVMLRQVKGNMDSFPLMHVGVSLHVDKIQLPSVAITELEINIKFPTCWDGVNLEAKDGQEHVVYSECDVDEHNECFEFACPDSHPVKMPEIHWYYRVLEYKGGPHVFADGTDVSLSEFFLPKVLKHSIHFGIS